ncbi:DUF4405 domain-containing protein [Yoonia maritima]|uniref:DUF4405 domain-containing protein n=1 Tax=Yoonia maritima TaxID=1435347 RepID=UPI001EF99985|nr:DUF4405 domain-containing protein [Yoonia maritima]
MLRSRILLDFIAVLLFVSAMAYWAFGNLAHEVIGTVFFALLIAHNVFNQRWYGTVRRVRPDPVRLFNMVIIAAMALSMMILLVTSILISKDVFAAVALNAAFAVRAAHMFVAFWALVFLGVHLGTRWTLVMTIAGRAFGFAKPNLLRAWALWVMVAAVAVKGAFAMREMGIFTRLRFQYALDMWDFNADMIGFFVNYLSIIGLLAALTYYSQRIWRSLPRRIVRGKAQ